MYSVFKNQLNITYLVNCYLHLFYHLFIYTSYYVLFFIPRTFLTFVRIKANNH